MLLVHQAASVKVGEVVRYTLTYTPSNDRILPTPASLHVKVKNTCAIPLRAAWVHGPYALHVSAYPATFSPHRKVENPQHDGFPQYEPMLKAGGSWQAELVVPGNIRETGADLGKRRSTQSRSSIEENPRGSVTWIIEVASQILFSSSASVNFEVLVGRDARSLDLGFAAVAGHGHGGPGLIKERNTDKEKRKARSSGNLQSAGVYSKAVRLIAEDTEALWDKPPLPSWDGKEKKDRETRGENGADGNRQGSSKGSRKRKKVHLVVVTHGMHSNVGADLLYLKESIDTAVAQARSDARQRKGSLRKKQNATTGDTSKEETTENSATVEEEPSTAPLSGGQEDLGDPANDSEDEEETIVRGFPGNAVRTENGIQYLGKRLAKYLLRFTYPDQPYLPVKKGFSRTLTDTFKSEADKAKRDGQPSHSGSSIRNAMEASPDELPYKFTSISFIGHSLGGLIQTYAVAYIHKHNPEFFKQIQPVNFVCMASPMLGLSNENPMYVKFALDFGLVGRTGQDLGLTWRPPTLAKGSWNAVIGGFGGSNKDQDKHEEDPGAKPLLRVLPTGPAHRVLRMFRNRTLYSNVVNDGIVPLRTSCLLFLDWRGLGKVDKARRENGLIGTVAEWGWAELTGANSNAVKNTTKNDQTEADEDDDDEHVPHGQGETVPQPDEDETAIDNKRLYTRASYDETTSPLNSKANSQKVEQVDKGIFDNFLNFFRNNGNGSTSSSKSSNTVSKKTHKALRRGQTIFRNEDSDYTLNRTNSATTDNPTIRPQAPGSDTDDSSRKRPKATKGNSFTDPNTGELQAPPKTSIFESAGDILHPPLPTRQWITDPESRARTIFHDRIYRPEDIPPPPTRKRQSTPKFLKSSSSEASGTSNDQPSPPSSRHSTMSQDTLDTAGMKVEEKIARGYHRDLTWRKVLVRLEPDAHNNMIVRRMFANAYGWPVIKHLCDTHFADSVEARTPDDQEVTGAQTPVPKPEDLDDTNERVHDPRKDLERTLSEDREAQDEVGDLNTSIDRVTSSSYSSQRASLGRQNSAVWDDSYLEGSDGEDSDMDERFFVSKILNPHAPRKPEPSHLPPRTPGAATATPPRTPPPQNITDGHRGLSPMNSRSPRSLKSPASQKSTFDAASVESPIITNRLVQEPERLEPQHRGSTAALGLRKSFEEHVSPAKMKPNRDVHPEST